MLQKGRRERRQAARQRRLGPLRAGSLRGSAPSRRRHPAGLRRPLAGALGPRFRIHQLVLLSEVGEGRAPRHSRCQLGGGLLRGGAESTSKIPRHLFTQGGDTGAQEAWAPPPRRLGPAVPDTAPPPAPRPRPRPSPYPQPPTPACWGGGGRGRSSLGWGAAVLLVGPSEEENRGPGGGVWGVEILQKEEVEG